MKSIKYYSLVLVLVLGLMGGAYAAWEADIVIEGTVDTGEMSVVFDDATVATDGAYDKISEDIEEEGKTLAVTMEDLYPRKDYDEEEDAYATLEVVLENDGTVPAILTGIEVEHTGDNEDVYDNLKVSIGEDEFYLKDVEDDMEIVPEEDEIIEPGDTSDNTELDKYLEYRIWLCEDADEELQNEDTEFDITFTFEQANLVF